MVVVGALASGCVDEPATSETAQDSTVADFEASGCSTAVVIGLSRQIAEQADCEHPGNFVSFDGAPGITLTSNAVLPYLDTSAKTDLEAVAAGASLQVNSALRTLAQQYLLYAWYQQGRCGITAAAAVGLSNHEGGRAVDLANYSSRISAMANQGWAYDVPGDVVHFDHTGSPDNRGEDVHAFQVLWNLNNPGDQIGTDGSYGPQTESRLKQSPATGFAMGPTCGSHSTHAASVVSVVGPDSAPPQTKVHYTITIQNSGQVAWPATTTLELASGTTSPLHDASWTSDTVVTTLGAAIAVGAKAVVDLDVMTPAAAVATPVSQGLQLDDSGTTFGTITLALTVDPGMTNPMPGDGNEPPAGAMGGGCNAGGGAAGWLLLALVVPFTVRARRRRAA